MSELVTVECPRCIVCGNGSRIVVRKSDLRAWLSGKFIQHAFPDLSTRDRELLISGTHGECYARLFPPPPDERITCDDFDCIDVGIGIIHHPCCGQTWAEFEEWDRTPDSPEDEETYPPDPQRAL